MGFSTIRPVPTPQHLKDFPFQRAMKVRPMARLSPIDKAKKTGLMRVQAFTNAVGEMLEPLVKAFPSIDGLNEFYQELTLATIDDVRYKKDVATLQWVVEKVKEQKKTAFTRIKNAQTPQEATTALKSFYGRSASLVQRAGPALARLKIVREQFLDFPTIKDGLFTIAIAGFPNVGKSTLLSKLTTAKPEIKNYAFTTKRLNIGYLTFGHRKLQFIDTPGTLSRPERMNAVERQAHLAMKYVADIIIWVYDPTHTYPKEMQLKLLEALTELDKPIFCYVSKTDIPHEIPPEVRKQKPILTTAELLALVMKEANV